MDELSQDLFPFFVAESLALEALSPESMLNDGFIYPTSSDLSTSYGEEESDLDLHIPYGATGVIQWQDDADLEIPFNQSVFHQPTSTVATQCGGFLKTSRISTTANVEAQPCHMTHANYNKSYCTNAENQQSQNMGSMHQRKKLPELPRGRKPLQKIRQASLLEELRETCAAKKRIQNPISGYEHLLKALTESKDAMPSLPPSFILSLVKSPTTIFEENKSKAFHPSSLILPDKLDKLGSTHRGLHRFMPRHADEIDIDIGDPIYVQREAEDLWCEGVNLRTLKTGIFPLAHVVDVDFYDLVQPPQSDSSQHHQPVCKERFLLQYIGSVETKRYKGTGVLFEAVKRILGAKEPPKKHTCMLEISDAGIKMVDKSNHNVYHKHSQDYFFDLKNVTFYGFHPSSCQYFGFVTRHPKLPKYACHIFLGEGSTQHISEACGHAIQRFYQRFMETLYPVKD